VVKTTAYITKSHLLSPYTLSQRISDMLFLCLIATMDNIIDKIFKIFKRDYYN